MEQDKGNENRDEKRTKVRRRLFADDEDLSKKNQAIHDNLTNDLLKGIYMDRKKMEEKWNFDFKNGQPLPGRWEWVQPHQKFKDNAETDGNL